MLRIGLVGAGANTRSRHIPGLLAQPGVSLAAVCNRRPESGRAVAAEFSIPRVLDRWEDLVADPGIDAVVIGTWPYLHAPITLAALAAGKHVLTEARLAMNAAEARAMLAARQAHPALVCQVVPSPFGLAGDEYVKRLLSHGWLGELREASVVHRTAALADPDAPLHWRQDAALSGVNMLTLGILHETLSRWLPQPARVLAQCHAFTAERLDPASGMRRRVGSPDSVQVLAQLPDGGQVCYQLSGATPFGQEAFIRLYGTGGALEYDLGKDELRGASASRGHAPGGKLEPLPIPDDLRGGWRVEEDFVRSIREG
ncbi:MAG: Gfo/Idh/MocA family oxidoreductase, partial [Gemmataceae bacterium]|nr:Gfo/Idh/MocA family oxidoreductase [Gemmataceae bacterium]